MANDTDTRTALSDWLGGMTRAGYDVVGSSVYTQRDAEATPIAQRHPNYPWQGITLHLRHAYDRRAPEVVFSSYGLHGSECYTCYASLHWGSGRKRISRFGFDVPGTERSSCTTSSLKEFAEWARLRTAPRLGERLLA